MKNTTLMWIFGGIALAGAATAGAVYLAKRQGVSAQGNAAAGDQPAGSAPKPATPPTNTLPLPPGSHYAAVDLLNAVAPIVSQYLPPNANPNARPEQLV